MREGSSHASRSIVVRPLAALVALLAVLVALTPVPATAATATPGAELVVAAADAGVLRPGRDLVVDVTVTNTGSARLPAGELAFSVDAEPVAATPTLLTTVAAKGQILRGYLLPATATTGELGAGESERIRVPLDRESLTGILSDASGTRILYTRLRAGDLQTVEHSAVTRMAAGFDRSAGFGTVVPITAPAGVTGLVDVERQKALTAPDGAWSAALDAARAAPSATIALDPAVIASVRLAGDDAPVAAQTFLYDLAALPNEVVRLPYADADLTLHRAAGVMIGVEPASFTGSSVVAAPDSGGATPTPAPTSAPETGEGPEDVLEWDWSSLDLAWPVPGTVTTGALRAIGAGGTTVLLGADDLADTPARAVAGPAARVGATDVLVADAAASRLLAAAAEGGAVGAAALSTLAGMLATTAVAGETPAVLAVPGRQVDLAGLTRTLTLLDGLAWVRGVPLSTLASTGGAAVGVQQGAVPEHRVAAVRSAVGAERGVEALVAAVSEPESLVGPERLALLGLLSASWRSQEPEWPAALALGAERFRTFVGHVRIAPGSPVNVPGADGEFPVDIVNELPSAVTVVVRASTSNARLQFVNPTTEVVVPADSGGRTVLPVRAITNGRVAVTLALSTPDGTPLGATTVRQATILAGFDAVVAIVLAVLLGGLLVVGVVRNVARARRGRPVA